MIVMVGCPVPVNRVASLAVVLVLGLCATVSGHDPERTEVTITFARDGSFTVDVAGDPGWLQARLTLFNGNFADRVVLWVDHAEVRPATTQFILPRSGDGLATYRLSGRLPHTASTLRWYYGLPIDPYPLTIRRPDGKTTTEIVQGDAWSGPIDMSGQFISPARAQVERQLPIAIMLAAFFAALALRRWPRRRYELLQALAVRIRGIHRAF